MRQPSAGRRNSLAKKWASMFWSHTERDEKTGLPGRPGAIDGGFYQRTDDSLSQYPSVVIAVDDIEEAKVEEAGGKVLGTGTRKT